MKTTRTSVTILGLSLVLFALAATVARAQSLASTYFTGTLTLPVDAQWGAMTLPKGDYTLHYGDLNSSGRYLVEVIAKTEGSPHGMILIRGHKQTSGTKNALVCIREGNKGYVRELEMGAIRHTVSFALPHGVKDRAWVVAGKGSHNANTQSEETPLPIQRVPVRLNEK